MPKIDIEISIEISNCDINIDKKPICLIIDLENSLINLLGSIDKEKRRHNDKRSDDSERYHENEALSHDEER